MSVTLTFSLDCVSVTPISGSQPTENQTMTTETKIAELIKEFPEAPLWIRDRLREDGNLEAAQCFCNLRRSAFPKTAPKARKAKR
jgi:hypothetical protein